MNVLSTMIHSNNSDLSTITCYNCNGFRHLARQCLTPKLQHSQPLSDPKPVAHYALSNTNLSSNPQWIMDTGATQYLTSNLEHLCTHFDYHGPIPLQSATIIPFPFLTLVLLYVIPIIPLFVYMTFYMFHLHTAIYFLFMLLRNLTMFLLNSFLIILLSRISTRRMCSMSARMITGYIL